MPEIESPLAISNCFTAFWHITESVEKLQTIWVKNDENLKQLQKRSAGLKQAQFLSSRILFQRHLGTEAVVFYNEKHQPELNGIYGISISHSEKYVLIAYSFEEKIGVDIQAYPKESLQKATHYYLSKKEQEELGTPIDLKVVHVYWSVKEAVFKLLGMEGLLLSQIEVSAFQVSSEGMVVATVQMNGLLLQVEAFYKFTNEYVAVIAKKRTKYQWLF